jgi:hypothetical protein
VRVKLFWASLDIALLVHIGTENAVVEIELFIKFARCRLDFSGEILVILVNLISP